MNAALSLLAASALVCSVWFRVDTLPGVRLCLFNTVTGLPCPGCGLTRAFCCIGHGEFARAWAFNPFSFLFYAMCLCLLFWPLVRRWCPEVEQRVVNSPWFSRWPVLLVTGMCVFGAWRIWHTGLASG